MAKIVISGGDPLILSPRRMAEILRGIETIAHVDIVRIHSRVPLVDPARIDAAMLAALATSKALFVVLHANHPREFAPAGRDACARLVAAGIPLLDEFRSRAAALTDRSHGRRIQDYTT